MTSLDNLPPEILSMIFYKFKAVQTPTARIINQKIKEWEEHKEEQLELINSTHVKLDECFFFDWIYFALNYDKSIYSVLFIFY